MKDSMESNKGSSVMGGVKKGRRGALAQKAGTGGVTEATSAADGGRDPGGEKVRGQAAPAQLLLWVLAQGQAPDGGWHKAVGRSNDEMKTLAAAHNVEVAELRLLQAIGAMVRDEQLAAVLRARLAEQLLAARSAKELLEAVRVYEKLPQLAGATGAQAEAAGEDDTDIEAAIAEARKLLSELDSLPRPEELEKLAEEGRSIIDAYTPGDTTS
jgi:uncharacterized protein with PIN domain